EQVLAVALLLHWEAFAAPLAASTSIARRASPWPRRDSDKRASLSFSPARCVYRSRENGPPASPHARSCARTAHSDRGLRSCRARCPRIGFARGGDRISVAGGTLLGGPTRHRPRLHTRRRTFRTRAPSSPCGSARLCR